ncbi:MAG: diadenylate cyclase [bacterium]
MVTIFLEIVDVLTTAFILYTALVILRKTRSIYILRGFFALVVFYILAVFLNLKLTTSLFQSFVSFFIIILVVIFQKEIRRFFENFSLSFIYSETKENISINSNSIDVIVNVVSQLAKKKTGALIVLPGTQNLERVLDGGIPLNGKISEALLISIFNPKTPGHDGAVLIEGDVVSRFGAHLPLADNYKKYPNIGTRHRAGLGLSERTDALTIVVSEERGTITIARNNELSIVSGKEKLKEEICNFMGICQISNTETENKVVSFVKYNLRDKIAVLIFSAFLWYFIVYIK